MQAKFFAMPTFTRSKVSYIHLICYMRMFGLVESCSFYTEFHTGHLVMVMLFCTPLCNRQDFFSLVARSVSSIIIDQLVFDKFYVDIWHNMSRS